MARVPPKRPKSRVTITLTDETLELIYNVIELRGGGCVSHAIEEAIRTWYEQLQKIPVHRVRPAARPSRARATSAYRGNTDD